MIDKRMMDMERLAREQGLDPFPVVFEKVTPDTMYNVCAYGLPTRARHWSYGRSWDHQKTHGQMGLSRVYEMIINNNPSYAFMLDSNTATQDLFIAAHCMGHSDFFKNNVLFKDSDRGMARHAAEHANRIDQYIEEYGLDAVERMMDIAFSLDRHIDFHKGQFRQKYGKRKIVTRKRHVREFDDLLRPKAGPTFVKEIVNATLPPRPEKDLMWFLINYAPIEDWERDILDMVREEAFYFYPQAMTKILNEGWACLCPDSLVFSPENGLVPIQNVADDALPVMDRSGKKQKVVDRFSGRKKCLTVKTKRGFSVSGAERHGVLVWDRRLKWKMLKDLSPKDSLVLPTGQECWSNKLASLPEVKMSGREREGFVFPRLLTTKVAKFFGYYLSEGHIGKDREIILTNGDRGIVEDMVSCIKDVFAYEANKRQDGSRYRVSICSAGFAALVEEMFGNGSRNKHIPQELLASPREVVISFLSAAFSGDGGAYEDGCVLALSTGVKSVASTIQLLLLNLGIVSSISTCRKYGYEDTYQVWISEAVGKELFSRYMNSSSPQKQAALDSMVSANRKKPIYKWSYSLDKKSLSELNKRLSGTTQSEQKKSGLNLWRINSKKEISLFQILSLEEMGISIDFLGIDKSWILDRVDSVSKPYMSQVVDMTVENVHEYQAQGFVNHNSYWHAELMYLHPGVKPEEQMEFARTHEKVVQPGGSMFRINPYYLGYRIFKDIEKRWDEKHKNGESELTGRQKMFQVRREEDDISFLRNYLTGELVTELGLFTFGETDEDDDRNQDGVILYEIKERMRDEVVESLVRPMYNNYAPKIVITDASSEKLVMKHRSRELGTLDFKHAEKTLEHIWELWTAPVELHTIDDEGEKVVITFDETGISHQSEEEELELFLELDEDGE